MEPDRCTLIQRAGFHCSPCVINIFQSLLATLPVLLPPWPRPSSSWLRTGGAVRPHRGLPGPPVGDELNHREHFVLSTQKRRAGAPPLHAGALSLHDSWPRGAASFASHRRAVGCSVPCRFSELFGPRSTACLSKPALEKTAVGTKCVWFQPKTARKE